MNANNESNSSRKRPSTVEKKIKGPTKEQLKEEVKLLRKEIKSLKEKIEWQTIPQQKNKTQEKYLFRKKGNENILAEVGSCDLVSFILDYHAANLELDFFSIYEIKINDNWETIRDSFLCNEDGLLIVEDIDKNDFIIKVRFFSNWTYSRFRFEIFKKNDSCRLIYFQSDSKEPGIRRAITFIQEKIALEEDARKAQAKAEEDARKAQAKAEEDARETRRRVQKWVDNKTKEEVKLKEQQENRKLQDKKEKAEEGNFWSWWLGAPKCANCGRRTKARNRTCRQWQGSGTTWTPRGYKPADIVVDFYYCEFCGKQTGVQSKEEV